jgi:hypothetical protein
MRAETPLFICDDPADMAAHLERPTAGPCEAANAILRLKVGVGWTHRNQFAQSVKTLIGWIANGGLLFRHGFQSSLDGIDVAIVAASVEPIPLRSSTS